MGANGSDFTIARELSPSASLADDGVGRKVILKKLPDDCCQRGQLHPNVKLRLQRLRELPLASFVNILGVERAETGVVMISEYVDGARLDEAASSERTRLLRELRMAVMSMHQLGMVHGAIKPGNVIIEPDGQLKLIDPSPLLHDDPQIDLRALDRMEASALSLPARSSPVEAADAEDRGFRQRTLVAAVALAMVAVGAAVAMAIYFSE